MKKVMVFGTFDILHKGHLDFFKQARQYGDELVVVIARNKNTNTFKGAFPDNDEKVRLAKVVESHAADVARLGYLDDPFKVIREENPDVICLGYDQHSYDAGLQKEFPNIKIVRLQAYKPDTYKSSILKHSQK